MTTIRRTAGKISRTDAATEAIRKKSRDAGEQLVRRAEEVSERMRSRLDSIRDDKLKASAKR